MVPKVGIIAYGVVGSAYHKLFPQALIYDLKNGFNSQAEINQHCQMVLVCVPTPMGDKGSCDVSAVESTMAWLDVPLIVLKSTVPIGTTEKLRQQTGKKIIFNPEFLRAVSAVDDLLAEKNIIIGGTPEESRELVAAYQASYAHALSFHFTTPTQAELIKYMRNSYLAMKVIFLNEMKELSDRLGLTFDEILKLWVLDERMGASHNQIDARGGFGGMCFPKDLNSLIHFAQSIGHNPKLLKTVWNRNTEFRDEFKDYQRYEL